MHKRAGERVRVHGAVRGRCPGNGAVLWRRQVSGRGLRGDAPSGGGMIPRRVVAPLQAGTAEPTIAPMAHTVGGYVVS